MRFLINNKKIEGSKLVFLLVFISFLSIASQIFAQTTPEDKTAVIKTGKVWGGVIGSGDIYTFNFATSGFFPNDYDILQYRGQGNDNFFGSGFRLAASNWRGPAITTDKKPIWNVDSIYNAGVFGPKNDYYPNGKVVVPMTNFVRYKYTTVTINGKSVVVTDIPRDANVTANGNETYDQKVEVTSKNLLGVNIKRKVLAWGQNFNDNYVIIDVELENVGETRKKADGKTDIDYPADTLKNFYFNIQQGQANNFYSNGSNGPTPNPQLPNSERANYTYYWQHYYGGRPGDSLRIFYAYTADDPTSNGDNMGTPVNSQNGRLLNTNYTYYSILHASKEPYTDAVNDVNDPLQPKVTYIGNDTKIPSPDPGEDEFGNTNYWAIRGGYSQNYLMTGSIPGTYHGFNSDEQGTSNFANCPGGALVNNASRNFSSFGPYTFAPHEKIHIVYAVGYAGIGLHAAKVVGAKLKAGILEDAPKNNLPPAFTYPEGSSELDKRKDRWISLGLDSVKLSAWRAKWNFEHKYQIPGTPPPPVYFNVDGYGTGVNLTWKDPDVEAKSGFAGYRIMRRLSVCDTAEYVCIYNSGPEDTNLGEHLFSDNGYTLGATYSYYIQAKMKIADNDPNADPTTRGKIIYSSRTYVPDMIPVNPPGHTQSELGKIRIVPNPFNINDSRLAEVYGNTTLATKQQIQFVNLPYSIEIKIYTENGDLVKTIVHDEPVRKSGTVTWNMFTENQQLINSGVYIAVFKKPDGTTSFQKFIVVR